MYQAAIFCRGWATHENSESFQVDSTIIWFNILGILQNRSCNCCTWKVSCWMVSWFSLNFWIEIQSTCCTCALFIFPIHAHFESAHLEELSPFVTIPLAIELVLDEIQQVRFVHPGVPYLVPPFVFVNHWCTNWVTRHEVLFWLELILPDSASDLYCLRAEFHSN